MKSDPRYTSNTVWDSFPWPQKPTKNAVRRIADASVSFRAIRTQLALKHNRSLRDLYRTLELPGNNPLKDAQEALDTEVRSAYDIGATTDALRFFLNLNNKLSTAETKGEFVRSAGLPEFIKDRMSFVTGDCIKP
jgi:hypothetical protein